MRRPGRRSHIRISIKHATQADPGEHHGVPRAAPGGLLASALVYCTVWDGARVRRDIHQNTIRQRAESERAVSAILPKRPRSACPQRLISGLGDAALSVPQWQRSAPRPLVRAQTVLLHATPWPWRSFTCPAVIIQHVNWMARSADPYTSSPPVANDQHLQRRRAITPLCHPRLAAPQPTRFPMSSRRSIWHPDHLVSPVPPSRMPVHVHSSRPQRLFRTLQVTRD